MWIYKKIKYKSYTMAEFAAKAEFIFKILVIGNYFIIIVRSSTLHKKTSTNVIKT